MTYSSYRVTVPGKLLIAGEYAVLEPNQQAVVIAVDRYLTTTIEPSIDNRLSLPQLGLDDVTWEMGGKEVQLSVSDSRLDFIQNSLSIVNQFLQENSVVQQPFHLTIKSELDDPSTGQKYGLGSSAAIVVAIISAVLTLFGDEEAPPTLNQVFKLSAIAHLKTQKNGSGVDIAASTFGGWLVYSSYNPYWVLNEMLEGVKISKLVEKPWPNLEITPIKPPSLLKLCVGWTGEPASTAPKIKQVKKFRYRNPEAYTQFLKKSSLAVARLVKSFEGNDYHGAISSLTENRKALIMLSEQADIPIETVKLKSLCSVAEKYGSGKSSGAGGGDCGIAFLKNEEQREALYKAWRNAAVTPLKLNVSQNGALVTEYTCEISLRDYLVGV